MKTQSTVWSFDVDRQPDYVWWENGFTKEECERIKEIGISCSLSEAKIGNNNTEVVEKSYRNSKVSWIFPQEDTGWIFRRLTDIIGNLNNSYYKFDLYGLVEGLQFSVYESPSGKYDFHIDRSINCMIRKLSFSLLLDDDNDYEGGDFEINTGKDITICPKKQGTVLVFPSYVLHRVTEVTSGTRNSLVGWVTGPAFK